MDSSTISVFVVLQLILAPILYPYGYLLEFLGISLIAYQNRYLREIELQLLEPLILIFLLTNLTLSAEMTVTGYAVRIMVVILMCYHSQRLQELSNRLISPTISILLLLELVAVKQLYPFGYLSQLLLIYFLYYNDYCSYMQKKLIRSQRSGGDRASSRSGSVEKGGSEEMSHSLSSSSESVEETIICKICFERFIDTTFANCGHCCCRECSESLTEKAARGNNNNNNNATKTKCPFCQAYITKKIELFFP